MSPGIRLRQARLRRKLRSIPQLQNEIHQQTNLTLSVDKLGRLERDQGNPTITEICAICTTLSITADWWLRGVSTADLQKGLERLSQKQQNTLLELIEMIADKP